MSVRDTESAILKALRKEKKLNQSVLAELLGVSAQAYQKYEYGTAELTHENLSKLADFYQVSTDYLLGRTTVREMNVLRKHEYTEEEVRSIDQELLDNYTALPVELRRSFIKMLEEMFDITFEVEEEDLESEYVYEDDISQGAAG